MINNQGKTIIKKKIIKINLRKNFYRGEKGQQEEHIEKIKKKKKKKTKNYYQRLTINLMKKVNR